MAGEKLGSREEEGSIEKTRITENAQVFFFVSFI